MSKRARFFSEESRSIMSCFLDAIITVATGRFLLYELKVLRRSQGQKRIPLLIFDFSDLHIPETNNS